MIQISLNPEEQWLKHAYTSPYIWFTYYKVTVSGSVRELHSSVFGRTVHEPMTDLISLLSSLVTPNEKCVDEMVPERDEEEK